MVTGRVAPVLSEDVFNSLKDLIKRRFGINLNGNKRLTLQTKLSHRLTILGLDNYEQYYKYLLTDHTGEELHHCVSHIVNNETYFMRERERLEAFRELLVDVKKRKVMKRDYTLNILSAGCSSGEEVYSLNIILLDSGLFTWGWETLVVGMDVSRSALKRAQEASYTENSFRGLSDREEFIKRYFYKNNNRYVLRDLYRKNTVFIHGNILSEGSYRGLPKMDFIFCRNVMIYLTEDALRRLSEILFKQLQDEGYLIIGSAETLIQKTDLFIPEYIKGVVLYRKNPHLL